MKRIVHLPAALVVALAAFAALAGCRSGAAEDPLLKLSAEESLAQGKELLTLQKYGKARPYFTHAFEVEPNSPIGREGLLLAADTYYQEGGTTNYVQAEAKYRDFLNRFPTSAQAAYVQFQIANSLTKRMEKPDRDQTVTRKALQAYQELARLYPTSEYAAQVQEQIGLVRNNLAEHEFIVGRFYQRYGLPDGAAQRFQILLQDYPQYPARDKVIFHLGQAYQESGKQEEADKAFEQLRTEFPQSPFLAEIPERRAQT